VPAGVVGMMEFDVIMVGCVDGIPDMRI
jgi:hypothetical protein